MDDNNTTQNEPVQTQEPAKEPVFTQSQKDKEIAMIINREREKFADYDDLKAKAEALETEKKERDLAEKTELEKAQFELEEMKKRDIAQQGQITEYEKMKARNLVLSDPKYSDMPLAYKNNVLSSKESTEVQESAEQWLDQWKKDTGNTVKPTFGVTNTQQTISLDPPQGGKGDMIKDPDSLAAKFRDKIQKMTSR